MTAMQVAVCRPFRIPFLIGGIPKSSPLTFGLLNSPNSNFQNVGLYSAFKGMKRICNSPQQEFHQTNRTILHTFKLTEIAFFGVNI